MTTIVFMGKECTSEGWARQANADGRWPGIPACPGCDAGRKTGGFRFNLRLAARMRPPNLLLVLAELFGQRLEVQPPEVALRVARAQSLGAAGGMDRRPRWQQASGVTEPAG